MNKERPELKRTLGRVEVFALSFGTMMGWGAIVMPVKWISSGGILGAILPLLLTTVMCVFVGLIYAELTSAFPLAGAELAFSYRSMGVLGSWVTGWMVCLAYIGIASFEGIALPMALNYLFPIPKWGFFGSIGGSEVYLSWVLLGISGALILIILNIIGIRQVAIFQIMLLLIMLFTGFVYILGGFAFGEVEDPAPLITDINGIETVLVMVPSMFIGFDMVAKSAEEMNMPLRNLPKVLIFSICAAGAWYVIITLVTYFLAPQGNMGSGIDTIADVAAKVFHSGFIMKMIIAGGICAIITTWNGFIVGASRMIFAMGRAKLLPGVFGKVHPKYKTPVFAIIFVGLFCCISPFLGSVAFAPFLNIVAFAIVICYLMVSLSFIIIRKKEPDLRREYRNRHGKAVGITAIVFVAFFLFWYTPFSPVALNWGYEWIFISVWILLGAAFFLIIKISESKNKVTPSEREVLIFSDEFAREISK